MNTVRIFVHTQNLIVDTTTALKTRMTRARTERGEGVISAAIAVLIMATIGALMYLTYINLFNKSAKKTEKMITLETFVPVVTP